MLLCLSLLFSVCFSKTCLITDYGAKADNLTDNIKAFQAAITDCNNGGTVLVPTGGIFMTSPIEIVGSVDLTLELASSAEVHACAMEVWPVVAGSYVDFLVVTGGSGFTLTGGTFDGRGTPWYIAFDQGKLNYQRPTMITVSHHQNLQVKYTKVLNSPMFNFYLANVSGGEFGWVNITSEWYNNGTMEPHNTDGIDPSEGSSDIWIHDCHIDNGDDCIAVKPGPVTQCTRNVLVENCQFFRGHGASIGSVGGGCVQDVVFRNISFSDVLVACRAKSFSDKPGFIKNITWQHIVINKASHCLQVNANYHPPPPKPVAWINVSNLVFEDIQATGCDLTAEFICPEDVPCSALSLNDVHLEPAKAMDCQFAHGTASDVSPPACFGAFENNKS